MRIKPLLPLGLLLIAAALAAVMALGARPPAPPAPPDPPLSAAIEETWGIRIKQVALTADGGLIDLRYTVLDPQKALPLLERLETTPAIEALHGGARVALSRPMAHKHDYSAGRTYYILYRNRDKAIEAGSAVAIVVGDLRLAPVIVR
jgi:hypothetical protein